MNKPKLKKIAAAAGCVVTLIGGVYAIFSTETVVFSELVKLVSVWSGDLSAETPAVVLPYASK